MITFLMIVHVIVCLAVVLVVLLQQGKGAKHRRDFRHGRLSDCIRKPWRGQFPDEAYGGRRRDIHDYLSCACDTRIARHERVDSKDPFR